MVMISCRGGAMPHPTLLKRDNDLLVCFQRASEGGSSYPADLGNLFGRRVTKGKSGDMLPCSAV
jgi:hypothetical protein